ncbi:MAG: amidase [bacterium]|nr:amidase [bacterium]MCP4305627.1 amidase [bacterium]
MSLDARPVEPHRLTAAALHAAYRARALSPCEVTQTLLDRIDALDSLINAFCLVDGEEAIRHASESERRWAAGVPLSPLDGVPIAVKDILLTKGWPTLRGSLTVESRGSWDIDSPCAARLREAGAVLVGKTTTPEFGWKGVTDSPRTGVTRNPWNRDKTPGGSSGGSAAALVAGFSPLALGTDGGGSIRMPAHFTGVYGLKPSFGRVPAYPMSPFGTVAHVGPMARTVDDAAMLLDVITGPDSRDWYALPRDPGGYAVGGDESLRGRRVAYSPRLGWAPWVDPEVEALVASAVHLFADLGADVDEIDPPVGDPTPIFRTLWWAAAADVVDAIAPEARSQIDLGLLAVAEEGRTISVADHMAATQARVAYGGAMRQFMDDYDFLLTPAVAVPAFDAGRLTPLADDGNAWLGWTPFSYPFNLTQQPAASVNCGFTNAGLPIGLQIVGRMFDDRGVLAASRAYERANPLFKRAPSGF